MEREAVDRWVLRRKPWDVPVFQHEYVLSAARAIPATDVGRFIPFSRQTRQGEELSMVWSTDGDRDCQLLGFAWRRSLSLQDGRTAAAGSRRRAPFAQVEPDRKSTRLNSS